jgi:hypothetical protein
MRDGVFRGRPLAPSRSRPGGFLRILSVRLNLSFCSHDCSPVFRFIIYDFLFILTWKSMSFGMIIVEPLRGTIFNRFLGRLGMTEPYRHAHSTPSVTLSSLKAYVLSSRAKSRDLLKQHPRQRTPLQVGRAVVVHRSRFGVQCTPYRNCHFERSAAQSRHGAKRRSPKGNLAYCRMTFCVSSQTVSTSVGMTRWNQSLNSHRHR